MSRQYLLEIHYLYDAHTITFNAWSSESGIVIIAPPVYANHQDPLLGISELRSFQATSFESYRELIGYGGRAQVQWLQSAEEVIDFLGSQGYKNEQQLISLFIRWYI